MIIFFSHRWRFGKQRFERPAIFLTFLFVVFAQTFEQQYILLKTKAWITVNNVFLSKQCLTQLICARRAIHSDTEVVIWLSNVKFGSKITPRSLADCTGEMSFPNEDKWNSWSLEVICRLPKTINFVLSGFSSNRFPKHQLRTCRRSSFISWTIRWESCNLKETNSFVSST